uniref:Mitochondrial DNA orf160 n=1 Tax=Oryza sativa subsp. japonica TaxID=39947 RepID=Q67TM9_ORYSJ|nr:mitochondrial DNA orf160 [Oryza sativa Japonica Group]
MSLPGTSSFIGEFLILVGAFQRNGKVRNFPYHYFRECEDFVTFLHFFLYTSGVALSAGELLFLDLPPVDEAPPSREILDLDLNAPLPDPEPEVEIVPGDDQHVPPIQEDNPITFQLQNDEQRESLEQMLHSVKERCIMKLRNELIVNKRSRKWGSTKF